MRERLNLFFFTLLFIKVYEYWIPSIYFIFLLMQEAVRISKENNSLQLEVGLFFVGQKYTFKISLWT